MDLIDWYSEYRREVLDRIARELNVNITAAKRDHHSHRRPRPCGLTVHTGVGCPLSCLYCYIYDMGFTHKASTYPLNPESLIYAIATNKNILLGKDGTFLALGSVTEPFLNETKGYVIKLVKLIRSYLENPIQISTKMILSSREVLDLYKADSKLSILCTIVAFKSASRLEPLAPPVEERIKFLGRLVKAGFKPTLFIRPIIPGITDREINDILKLAFDAGVESVVFGTLRVTRSILEKLRIFPEVYEEIIRRLGRKPLTGNKQISIKGSDLKKKLVKLAREYGFKIYPSACAANVYIHGLHCYMCNFGPCGNINKLPEVDAKDIAEFIKWLSPSAKVSIRHDNFSIQILFDKNVNPRVKSVVKFVVSYAYKREVKIYAI